MKRKNYSRRKKEINPPHSPQMGSKIESGKKKIVNLGTWQRIILSSITVTKCYANLTHCFTQVQRCRLIYQVCFAHRNHSILLGNVQSIQNWYTNLSGKMIPCLDNDSSNTIFQDCRPLCKIIQRLIPPVYNTKVNTSCVQYWFHHRLMRPSWWT